MTVLLFGLHSLPDEIECVDVSGNVTQTANEPDASVSGSAQEAGYDGVHSLQENHWWLDEWWWDMWD